MNEPADQKAKRILIFSLAYYPRFVGGAEIAVKEITDRIGLVSDGTGENLVSIEFDMITLRFDKNLPTTERIGNVNVHRIGFAKPNPNDQDLLRFPLYLTKVFYAPLAAWKARKLHRTRHYDALWSMMSYMGFPALFFNAFRRQKNKLPLILTLQEGDSLEQVAMRWRIRIFGPLYRAIFRRATIVQTISHYLAGFVRKMHYDGKIEVIPNGVDLALFGQRLSDTETFELKTKLGKKYTDTFLITTSRLVPKNGIGDIIEALSFLPAEIKLIIIGSGPQENELKQMTLKLGLSDRVQFLGFVPHTELPKYLRVSDIFIRPSLSEGFGNSFVEAMAAEIPVIATPVGGIVDFLEDRHTGLFCEVHNPHSIARAVEKILESGEFRTSLVLNAKKMVIERYDWNLIVYNMRERVFERVLLD